MHNVLEQAHYYKPVVWIKDGTIVRATDIEDKSTPSDKHVEEFNSTLV